MKLISSLVGYVNKQNLSISDSENPQVVLQKSMPITSDCLVRFAEYWLILFDTDDGATITAKEDTYRRMTIDLLMNAMFGFNKKLRFDTVALFSGG